MTSKATFALVWLAMFVVREVNGLKLKSSVVLDSGGYTNVVVAIAESLPENMALITAIQDTFRDGSVFLYQATRQRVYFKNVTILIPSHWTQKDEYGSPGRLTFETADVIIAQPNPLWAPEPYTQQVLGCGQPGSFIHFTDEFLTDSGVTSAYGELGRILVHEWGHYRWGLFNEYPDEIGDAAHVTHFYQSMASGRWRPVTCSQEYRTLPTLIVERPDGTFFRQCHGNETIGYEDGCIVNIQGAGQATGSIMNGPLTLTQIVNFCDDDSSDPGNLHNREAPNKHNRLCNSMSAWEVMGEHEDFKDGNSPPLDLNNALLEPRFNLVQARTGDECRVVLVLDTSGSMSAYNRIEKVNSAATAFINLLDDGIWVGIVTFTSSPITQHALTQIRTEADRDSLRNILPFSAGGGTCIGCGLERGLQVLMEHPSGIVGGGIILLMTDGRDSGITNHAIRQTLRDMEVRVNSVAIGQDADGQLSLIAQETGGTPIFYPDEGVSDIVSALTQTVEMCIAVDSSQMRIQLVGEGFSLDSGDTKEGNLYFDPLIGNRTQFIVTYTMSTSSSSAGVNVTIMQPDNTTITSNDPQYNDDTTRKVVTISIDDQAMSGRWMYSIENAFPGAQSVTLSVYSRTNFQEEEEEPIVFRSSVGNSIINLSSRLEPLVAFAQLSKGFRPVVKAIVRAIIERPGGYPPEIIQLFDDGAGADTTANDGIYSRFFTNITGMGFYGIRVISENDGSASILTRAQSGISRVQASIRVTDDGHILSAGNIGSYEIRLPGADSSQTLVGEPAPSFTRSSSAGSTMVTALPDGFTLGQDLFPPNRVQDLRVQTTHLENLTLVLTWTAPGDDLDAGAASSYDIRIGNSSRQLQIDFANTTRVVSSHIPVGNLTSPKPFGSSETFVIVVPDMPELESFSYRFALRATDDDGQTSPVSNVAIATFRRVVPTAPCPGVFCLNGGELLESNCTCSCTEDFQGNLCQHNKSQLRNGVQIHLQVNITQCEQLLTPLISAAVVQLNAYCQQSFATCCPSEGIVTRPQGQYVIEENVMIADGYPALPEQSDGCYVVLYAIQPVEPELCAASGSNKRRKRSFIEIHRARRQLSGEMVYVPQNILFAALLSGEQTLEMALGTEITVTLPRIDGDPLMTRAIVPAYLIGVAVAIVTFFVIVALCLFVCCARASVGRETLNERDVYRSRDINYGPRFMKDGRLPLRNIRSISGEPHLQISRSHRPRQPGHQSRSRDYDDVYAVASYPMPISSTIRQKRNVLLK